MDLLEQMRSCNSDKIICVQTFRTLSAVSKTTVDSTINQNYSSVMVIEITPGALIANTMRMVYAAVHRPGTVPLHPGATITNSFVC
jgi:hypothetical protein